MLPRQRDGTGDIHEETETTKTKKTRTAKLETLTSGSLVVVRQLAVLAPLFVRSL